MRGHSFRLLQQQIEPAGFSWQWFSFGSDLESSIAAVKKIIERLENPLGAVTEKNAEFMEDEKTFYTALLNNLA